MMPQMVQSLNNILTSGKSQRIGCVWKHDFIKSGHYICGFDKLVIVGGSTSIAYKGEKYYTLLK